MKTFRASLKWAGVVLICMFMSGCASMRLASTMKPSGDTQLKLGQARFSIIDYSTVFDKSAEITQNWQQNPTARQMEDRAKVLYPEIFADDWTALPVMVKTEMKYDSSSMDRAAMITGLTLGIVPIPGSAITSYGITTDVRDALGESMAAKKVGFDIDMVTWLSIFGPLGSLPVPGQADLPRDTVLFFIPLSGDPYMTENKTASYHMDCIIEAIVRNLRSIDIAKLESAIKARQSRLQEVTIDGRRCWSYLAPNISKEGGQPVSFTSLLYREKPDRSTKPYAETIVARRGENGGWVAVKGYLRTTRTLTAVSTLMENGAPSRIVVRVVEEPPLEDFIDTPDLSSPDRAETLRWSNGILLEAKNRSLENLLRDESRNTLLSLATRIEKSILELNEQAERAKDSAQAKVEKGEGDPAPDRELSILCRQRIEVLKPILAALKQGAAAKRQGQ